MLPVPPIAPFRHHRHRRTLLRRPRLGLGPRDPPRGRARRSDRRGLRGPARGAKDVGLPRGVLRAPRHAPSRTERRFVRWSLRGEGQGHGHRAQPRRASEAPSRRARAYGVHARRGPRPGVPGDVHSDAPMGQDRGLARHSQPPPPLDLRAVERVPSVHPYSPRAREGLPRRPEHHHQGEHRVVPLGEHWGSFARRSRPR